MEAAESPVARRELLRQLLKLGAVGAAATGLGFWLRERSRRPVPPPPVNLRPNFAVPPDPRFPAMVVVRGGRPEELVRRAIEQLGGARRFIARGDVVTIKPNIAWDRTPEQAANTNPEVVAEMVRLCFQAGAARVVVTDVSCNDPRRSFERSGIAAAATSAGAEVILPDPRKFRRVDLGGHVLGVWPVLAPFVEADKMINIPVAKNHSLTRVTLGMKNWYGILGGQRHRLHQRIQESIAELANFMRPTLTLIDAYRVLLRNGPTGGNLADVALEKTLIAGTDPVALDAYTAHAYWGLSAGELPYLKLAAERGLGREDFQNVPARFLTL